jgi:hypothetical protein
MRLAICVCRRRAALALVVMLGSALLLQQENLGVARAERVLVMPEDLTLPLMSRLRQDQLDTLFIQGEAAPVVRLPAAARYCPLDRTCLERQTIRRGRFLHQPMALLPSHRFPHHARHQLV